MSDTQRLIELLKNDNPNKRYDACEELRVSPQPLPQEAIDALRNAISDSNPSVAEAAQRALALHVERAGKSRRDISEKNISSSTSIEEYQVTTWQTIKIGATGGYFTLLILAIFILDSPLYAPMTSLWGIPSGILGAFAARHFDNNPGSTILGSVIGVILAVVCFLYLIFTCSIGC